MAAASNSTRPGNGASGGNQRYSTCWIVAPKLRAGSRWHSTFVADQIAFDLQRDGHFGKR